jgi:hypothetical protein
MICAFHRRWLFRVSFSIGGCPRRLPTFVEEEAIEQVCFSHVFFFSYDGLLEI